MRVVRKVGCISRITYMQLFTVLEKFMALLIGSTKINKSNSNTQNRDGRSKFWLIWHLINIHCNYLL